MLLSFAVQFWTNYSPAVRFEGTPLGDVSKIRDTQMANRTSQPLNLGCPAVWDTPGKLCFFTSQSYWGQFWVVCPPLWYESTLSNTPRTLRKVIPVKDFSGEQTEYWIKLGKLWVKIHWPKTAGWTIMQQILEIYFGSFSFGFDS